jgi:uridine kinase
MEIADAVKLVYQSEFAGGHLIADTAQSEARLEEERRKARSLDAPSFVFEEIGGGLCRLHLGSLDALGLSTSTANRFFVNTARAVRGDIARFEEKLSVLLECCREGLLPFSEQEAAEYIASLKEKGYPPVSHSEAYRAAYHPAYRVVSARYRDYIEVFCRIDTLMNCVRPVVIAIDGGSASGKTSLAALLADVYDANVIHMDDFFLPPERKTPQRMAEPGGNVDYERFAAEVAPGIRGGKAFEYHAYSCKTGTLMPVKVTPRSVCIVEGAYSLHPALAALAYDLTVFLDINKTEQSRRIVERNGKAMHKRFMEEWIPLEDQYFAAADQPGRGDLVYRAETGNRE